MAVKTPHAPRAPEVNVNVDDEVIADSTVRDSAHCMIAEAVKKAYPKARNISVDVQTIRFSDPDRRLRFTYLTPRIAQDGLVKFDQGIAPDAFSFRLRKGQVTRMAQGKKRELTEKQKKERPWEKGLAQAHLVTQGASASVPVRKGGTTPPLAKAPGDTVPYSRRRQFGLRAFDRTK